MNYTSLVLAVAGLIGVLLHNLVKINDINKDPNKGNFKLAAYWSKEWASIAISCIVVVVSAYFQAEIKQLEQAGKWLGLGFVALGYMAQSVLVSFMGKASKVLGSEENKPSL